MVLQVTGLWTVLGIGIFGGLLAELAKWIGLRETNPNNFPAYAKSIFYWLITIILMIVGGILAVFYGYTNVDALLALNVGASAPLIIRALASTTPSGTPGGGQRAPANLINFLAGR
jgi:divalent metal cation (Fe/Co/Zn/Cd) transporter